MAEYFSVDIIGFPGIAYEELSEAGITYLDATGTPVDPPTGGLRYISRSGVLNPLPWMSTYTAPDTTAVISVRAFLLRFTSDERTAVRAAAKTSFVLEDWLAILNAGTRVYLNAGTTQSGVNALVTFGLLTSDRATQILDPIVRPGEAPDV